MTVLSMEALVAAGMQGAPEDRMGLLLEAAGCKFHDSHRRLLESPAVGLLMVGGIPAADFEDIQAITASTMRGAGFAAAMSYLTADGPLDAVANKVLDQGHHSIMHVVQVSLMVAGVSVGVENEFNSQRDLLHMARVTVARTRAQSRPPVVVPDPSFLDVYIEVLGGVDGIRGRLEIAGRDDLEAANLLYPAGKATAFVLSGSLRNFEKLLGAETDPGKEAEFRRVLGLIRGCLGGFWPSLFKPIAEG